MPASICDYVTLGQVVNCLPVSGIVTRASVEELENEAGAGGAVQGAVGHRDDIEVDEIHDRVVLQVVRAAIRIQRPIVRRDAEEVFGLSQDINSQPSVVPDDVP